MQAASAAVDSLKDLLGQRLSSRSRVSTRFSQIVLFFSVALASVSIWAAVSMDRKVRTMALYVLMAFFVALTLCVGFYCLRNIRKNKVCSEDVLVTRSWHKVGYKVLVGLVIVEHFIFFVSMALMVFHSLGLSLSQCFAQRVCLGSRYQGWYTISYSGYNSRVQRYLSQPVEVYLSSTQRALFWAFMSTLFVGLVSVGVFFYAESLRRSVDQKGSKITWMTQYRWRLRFVHLMGGACFIPLILSVVGISTVGSNWFSASIILSIVSMYPVFLLKKSLTADPAITRFQFRKTAQICISLMLVWLYCYGAGASTSLISAVSMQTEDEKWIMDKISIAQIVMLLVFHILFAISAAGGIYLHVSISDIAESITRTAKTLSDDNTHDLPLETHEIENAFNEEVPKEDCRATSVASWGSKLCASCSTHAPNSLLVPCGHSVICSDCCNVLLTIPGFRCPLCCVEVFDCQRYDATPRYSV